MSNIPLVIRREKSSATGWEGEKSSVFGWEGEQLHVSVAGWE